MTTTRHVPRAATDIHALHELGDIADQVTLAIHREQAGRNWNCYRTAVHKAYATVDLAAHFCDTAPHTPVNLAALNAYGTITRFATPTAASPAPDRTALSTHRDQLHRLLTGTATTGDLTALHTFFTTIAETTLDHARHRPPRAEHRNPR